MNLEATANCSSSGENLEDVQISIVGSGRFGFCAGVSSGSVSNRKKRSPESSDLFDLDKQIKVEHEKNWKSGELLGGKYLCHG